MDPLITAVVDSRMRERIADAEAWRLRAEQPRRRLRPKALFTRAPVEAKPCL